MSVLYLGLEYRLDKPPEVFRPIQANGMGGNLVGNLLSRMVGREEISSLFLRAQQIWEMGEEVEERRFAERCRFRISVSSRVRRREAMVGVKYSHVVVV